VNVHYSPEEGYKGQEGQDKWANENVFHGKTGGVFVDLGCYDGITYSNTWYFERRLNWIGLCVEPNPLVYARIAQSAGRTSGVQLAVSNAPGTMEMVAAYMRSSLNASFVDYALMRKLGVNTEKVQVTVVTPTMLLERLPAREGNTIDYVNIDVESQELAILATWPFSDYCVSVFNIENQPREGEPSTLSALKQLLTPHGYSHKIRIGVDEVFVRDTLCDADGEHDTAGAHSHTHAHTHTHTQSHAHAHAHTIPDAGVSAAAEGERGEPMVAKVHGRHIGRTRRQKEWQRAS